MPAIIMADTTQPAYHVLAGAGPPPCVRERALSGWCKSISGLPTEPVAESNCVIARWGGEQLEAKKQSVGDEPDSAVPYGELPVEWRSPDP